MAQSRQNTRTENGGDLDRLESMPKLLPDLVQTLQRNGDVVGVAVFGSYVRQSILDASDLDLLVVRRGPAAWSREGREMDGTILDVNTWPLKTLKRLFSGHAGNLLADAFLFEAFRSGKILHDPTGELGRFREYAHTHRIHSSHLTSLGRRISRGLDLAERLLEEGELEGAELELRKGTQDTSMALLLKKDLSRIHPPKAYLPQIRCNLPAFHEIIFDIENLEHVDRSWVEASIKSLREWRQRLMGEIARQGRTEWLKKGAIRGTVSELGNAESCLKRRDWEAAALQVRYSALLLASPVLRLLRGTSSHRPSTLYLEISRRGHRYADTLRDVMSFSHGQDILGKRIQILRRWSTKSILDEGYRIGGRTGS